ncbi:MAG: penicillin acylase family protein [Bryobacteraceae bacterium]
MLALLLILAIPAAAETVEILRDSYGTPHIFATTAAGAAFGAGYAQAQDRREALLKNLSAPGESVALPAELQAVVTAYVAGVNQGLGESRVNAAQVIAFSRRAYTWIHGSNDLFLPPSRTISKSLIAVLDPIADWNASDRPYEMSLYASQGDLSLAGVAPPGMPFPVVGHSQRVAIGWSGDAALAGPRALEEAWSLITARDLGDLRAALAMQQIPGRASCGTVAGELCSTEVPANLVVREKLRVQNTWSFSAIEALALSTEVYGAEVWVRRLASLDPNARLVQQLRRWNGRADADSRGALAFYIFKMELGRDAAAVEPPDSLSKARILSAITRALDKLETENDFNANWGSVFRITRDGARVSVPAFGGILPEAGIETPRKLFFRDQRAYAGQAATRVVELSNNPSATSILLPGVSDDPESRYFADQARLVKPKSTYFRNRRELERAVSSRQQVTF